MPAIDTPQNGKRLDSWKEISAYLNREVRTAMRWEKERGLPVHRIPGKRSGVYALSSEVDAWLRAEQDASGSGALSTAPPPTPHPKIGRSAVWSVVSAIVLLGAAAVRLALSIAGPGVPQLHNPVAITNNGLIKQDLMLAGRSLYFVVRDGERWVLMRSPFGAAAPTPVKSYPPGSFWPLDISRNESEILASWNDSFPCPCPLWAVPASTGSHRKLVDLPAGGAAWSPDGKMLAYANGRGLYLANRDGTMPRKLINLPERAASIRWSPDAKRIRLVTESGVSAFSGRLWDVELDRPIARKLLPGWTHSPRDFERTGGWTPTGEFFVFAAVHEGAPGLFAIHEGLPFFASAHPNPITLSTSAEGVSDPVVSPDGKKIFALVRSNPRGELIRLEPESGQSVVWPGMPGLSAGHVSFSPDGRQTAYVSYPELNLWKMNADGTEKRQLTFGTSKAAMPQWSPDGHHIAFMGWDVGGQDISKIRIIAANGGPIAERVTWPGWQGIPTWTPDGASLIFGENGHFNPISPSCTIHRFDFKTGKTADLPNTTGLWTARASPTGRYVAATPRDNRKLVLYDMQTATVTDLVAFPDSKVGDNPTWSKDGKFVYIDAPFAPGPAIYRIRIADKRIERIASLKGIQRADGGMDHWIGLTQDGSPLVTRRVRGAEIYAWDWIAP